MGRLGPAQGLHVHGRRAHRSALVPRPGHPRRGPRVRLPRDRRAGARLPGRGRAREGRRRADHQALPRRRRARERHRPPLRRGPLQHLPHPRIAGGLPPPALPGRDRRRHLFGDAVLRDPLGREVLHPAGPGHRVRAGRLRLQPRDPRPAAADGPPRLHQLRLRRALEDGLGRRGAHHRRTRGSRRHGRHRHVRRHQRRGLRARGVREGPVHLRAARRGGEPAARGAVRPGAVREPLRRSGGGRPRGGEPRGGGRRAGRAPPLGGAREEPRLRAPP